MIPAGNLSGNASRGATVRAAPPDSGNITRRRDAAPPFASDDSGDRVPPPSNAGKPSGFRSKAATVRPCGGSGRPSAPPVSLSGKPWRPCAAPEASGLSAVRPFDRWPEAGKRPPPSNAAPPDSPPSNASTVRPCRKRPPVPRQSQAVRAGFPPPSNAPPDSATVRPLAGSVRAAGTPRNRSRLSAVRKSPPSNAGKPWRPCAAGFRPMSPDSSRRVRNRWPSGLLSRQPFASRPPNFAGNAPQPPAVASARAGRVRARHALPRPCKAVYRRLKRGQGLRPMSANAGSGQPSATIGKPSRRSTV